MRKREELTNPASCMSRARDDEMTFVLLGRDSESAATVLGWIVRRILARKNKPTDPQIIEALQWVETVMEEQGNHA